MMAISQFVSMFLLHSLWQITLIFLLAQSGAWAMCEAPARFRYRLWMLAIALAILLPLVSRLPPFSFLQPALVGVDHSVFLITARSVISRSESPLADWAICGLFFAYAMFLIVRILEFFRAWRGTRELRESGYLAKSSAVFASAMENCAKIFDGTNIQVRCSRLARSPMTVGFWSPQILLPADMLQQANEEQCTAMLAHEMAHVRRCDFAKNLLCELLSLPVSFHPLARYMKSQLATCREIACDELAVERCIAPNKYVRSLLALAADMVPVHEANYGVGIFDGNILEERVMKLLHTNRLSVFWSRFLLGAVLFVLVGAGSFACAFAAWTGETQDAAQDTFSGYEQGIARVGENGVTVPRATYAPDPEYPKSAKKAKLLHGEVTLWCVVDIDGMPQRIRVTKSSSPYFDKNAIAALQRWRFEPAKKNGQPVAVQINVQVDFRIY